MEAVSRQKLQRSALSDRLSAPTSPPGLLRPDRSGLAMTGALGAMPPDPRHPRVQISMPGGGYRRSAFSCEHAAFRGEPAHSVNLPLRLRRTKGVTMVFITPPTPSYLKRGSLAIGDKQSAISTIAFSIQLSTNVVRGFSLVQWGGATPTPVGEGSHYR